MTTTVRSVKVRLEAEVAAYIAEIKRAGTETDKAFAGSQHNLEGLNKNLETSSKELEGVSGSAKRLDGNVSKADASVQRYTRATEKASPSNKKLSSDLDSVSGRLGLVGEAALLLGPSFAPIASVGIPALAGLSDQLLFAAGGAGATVLALNGVGDALKAIQAAHLDPTVANLQAARLALQHLGPDAINLVGHLEDLRDVGRELRDTAAHGILPGVDQALTSLERRLPAIRQVLRVISQGTGDAIASAGRGVAGGGFDSFFAYLQHQARPILDDTADAVGHLAHGIAEVFVGTAPLQRGFSSFIKDAAEGFDDWASRLSQSGGVEDFLAYVRAEGPQVEATFGAIADAVLQIVEDAAPLGGPVLQTVEELAHVVGAIAGSDLGTPIIEAASALTLVNRALKVTKSLAGSTFLSGAAASGRTQFAGLAAQLPTLRQAGQYLSYLGQSTANASAATKEARSAVYGFGRAAAPAFAKAALGAAAFAFATSGAAQSTGLTNTATLGLAGTMLGKYGGAIGAGIGLLVDFSAESKRAGASTRDLDAVLHASTSTYLDRVNAISKAQAAAASVAADYAKHDSVLGALSQTITHPVETINYDLSGLDGSDVVTDAKNHADQASYAMDQLSGKVALLGLALGKDITTDGLKSVAPAAADVAQILQQAGPALDHFGVSLEDLSKLKPGQLRALGAEVSDYLRNADSASGRTQALSAAIRDLNNDTISTAQSASQLTTALNTLLSPQLDLTAASDGYTTALRHLDEDLAKHNKTLSGNSDAAIKNRAAIGDRVTDLEKVLGAEAAAGASAGKLSESLKTQRTRLIDAGAAAGISRTAMRAYLDTLGLTPKLVRTLIEANPRAALSAIDRVKAQLAALHDKTVNINVRLNQANASNAGPAHGSSSPAAGNDTPRTLSTGTHPRLSLSGLTSPRHVISDALTLSSPAPPRVYRAAPRGTSTGSGPMRIVGTLNTKWGPAELIGTMTEIADQVSNTNIDNASRFDDTRRGARP